MSPSRFLEWVATCPVSFNGRFRFVVVTFVITVYSPFEEGISLRALERSEFSAPPPLADLRGEGRINARIPPVAAPLLSLPPTRNLGFS